MAKKKTTKASAGTAVATQGKSEMAIVEEYGDFGRPDGWDNTDATDFAIPILNLLQSNSDQCKQKHEKRVEGAEPGMFIDSVTGQLYPSGVTFVPVYTEKKVVEWVPRDEGGGGGAGFVGAFAPEDAEVLEALSKCGGDRRKMKSSRGNDLVDTRYIYAMVLANVDDVEPFDHVMLAFSKTKIQPYRKGMSTLRKAKGSGQLPLYVNRLSMTSFLDSNNAGDEYHNVSIEPAVEGDTVQESVLASRIPPQLDGEPHPLLLAGRAFKQSVAGGDIKVDYSQGGTEGAAKGENAKDGVF